MLRWVVIWLAMFAATAQAETTARMLSFENLTGWARDDHHAALDAFLETCTRFEDAEWGALCNFAKASDNPAAARAFFELFFRPVMIEDGAPAHFTGYFEPELLGAHHRSARFRYPLYPKPSGDRARLTRQQIEQSNALAGSELVWIDNPVDVYYLQIQGSGRVRLSDGGTMRVGYGGENGHPNRSIAQELIDRRIMGRHQASAANIRQWVRRNPALGQEILWSNPSYVFFRRIRTPDHKGPLGAMNRSITALRSLAVDPRYVPLGAPVWMEKSGNLSIQRLMIAQDTGGDIKGAQRADVFIGTGESAGKIASQINDTGRMVVLMPIQLAFEMVPEGAE